MMEKIKSRKIQIQIRILEKKMEKELISTFKAFSKQIFEDLAELDDSPQLLKIVNIGNAFRETCEEIGQSSDLFGKHFDFLNIVRDLDREMERKIEAFKRKYGFEEEGKFRVENKGSTDHIKSIIQTLKSVIQDFHIQIKEIQSQDNMKNYNKGAQKKVVIGDKIKSISSDVTTKIRDMFEIAPKDYEIRQEFPFLKKSLTSIFFKIHPEKIPSNHEKIDEFRTKMNLGEIPKLDTKLTLNEEIKIAKAYYRVLKEKVEEYEALGWFTHISRFIPLILASFEKIAVEIDDSAKYKLEAPHKIKIKNKFREFYRDLEEWFTRVQLKYENEENRNSEELKVRGSEFQEILESYAKQRESRLIEIENHQIWTQMVKPTLKQKDSLAKTEENPESPEKEENKTE